MLCADLLTMDDYDNYNRVYSHRGNSGRECVLPSSTTSRHSGIPDKRPPDKKLRDKGPPVQKATKLVFLWRNLRSPEYVFFYSRAGEKMTEITLFVFVAVVYCNRSSF